MNDNKVDWKKYLIVFLFTTSIFMLAGYLSSYVSSQKIESLKEIQNQIAIDILSSETQYSLLSELSCKNVSESFLAGELGELGQKLTWGEKNLGKTEEVVYLRKYYSLLQIKDYLLMKKVAERCDVNYAFILYFYTNRDDCGDCEKTSLVLSSLRDKYPMLRVYSFDYSTDLSAVRSMLEIYQIDDTKLPALVIDDETLTGFHDLEEVEGRIIEAFGLDALPQEENTEDIILSE